MGNTRVPRRSGPPRRRPPGCPPLRPRSPAMSDYRLSSWRTRAVRPLPPRGWPPHDAEPRGGEPWMNSAIVVVLVVCAVASWSWCCAHWSARWPATARAAPAARRCSRCRGVGPQGGRRAGQAPI